MVKARVLFALLALVLCLAPLQAATFVVPPDEWLIDEAPVIVSGTVVAAQAHLRPDNDIETVFRFAIDEVLKGSVTGSSIDVVEWGGELGDRWMTVSGGPRYEAGKRYVAFLVRTPDGRWATDQLTLGRFEYVHQNGRELLVRDAEEISGWDIRGHEAVEVDRPAESFKTLIRERALHPDTPRVLASNAIGASGAGVGTTSADYDFADAANIGVARWSDDSASDINFTISGSAAAADTKSVFDGEDRIIEEDPHGDIAGTFNGAGVVATAFYGGGGNHTFESVSYKTITAADVVTQDGVKASSGMTQEKIRTTLVHEIGHTLGFRHSDRMPDDSGACAAPLPCSSTSTIMRSSVQAGLNGVLGTWDKDAAASSYGAGGSAADYSTCADNSCTTKWRRSTPSASFHLAPLGSAPCGAAPAISTQPANKSITVGGTTSLSVSATGGTLTYQWYIGSLNTDESSPVGGATNATLTNLSPASTTSYWVKVTNACGSTRSNVATVTVNSVSCTPPSISAQPQPKSVSLGSSAKMSVTAAGTGPFTYQWYVGNSGDTSSPIPGATSASPNITLNATANVWVRVTGQCAPAADSNSVTITINPCVSVVVGIPTATGAGTNWTLSVSAASTAPGSLTFEWYRGSNPGSPNAPKVGEGQTLPVTVTTITQFWARVTNSCGSFKDSEVVAVAPCQLPVISAQPADRTIFKGASTQLTVGVTGEGIGVQWYQGVAPDKSIPVAGGTSINVGPLQTTTSYWAALLNTCGEISTRTVIVTVDESCTLPTVTAEPPNRTVSPGTSTDLTVGFTGENVTVQWYRGTAPDKSNPLQTGATITVGPILTTTSYWATLTNACGEVATHTVVVTVEGSCVTPVITTQPLATQEVSGGTSATLHVEATGTPDLHYQWYEAAVVGDITKPVGTDSSTFITPPLFGEKKYWVKVSNACGSVMSNSARVTVAKGRRHAVRS